MQKRFLILLAAIVPLLDAGCVRPVNRAAERKIRDALPKFIGPARIWRAHVENAPERTARGRLSRVIIDGEDVDLRKTIRLSRLHIEMHDAVVDVNRGRLKSVGRTTFGATVAERDLNTYLRSATSPDDSVRIRGVRLGNNRISLDAGYKVLGTEIGFAAEVEPRLESPSRLAFDPERFSLFGLRIPLPGAVLKWISVRLTDGFDFSTLPFPVMISSVQVRNGGVDVSGTADVMRSLNERISLYLESDRESRATAE